MRAAFSPRSIPSLSNEPSTLYSLVDRVEESADVISPGEIEPCELYSMFMRRHSHLNFERNFFLDYDRAAATAYTQVQSIVVSPRPQVTKRATRAHPLTIKSYYYCS